MEPTILQFLIGVFAGTAAGLVIVQKRGHGTKIARRSLTKNRPLSTATKSRAAARAAKTRASRRKSLSKRRMRPQIDPTQEVVSEPLITASSESSITACPSCGLEAPGALMAEHFLGSPSHENSLGAEEPAIMKDSTAESSVKSLDEDEDPRSSLRSLLQMLVPPRAFGHRHQQRTVNPLSSLVRRVEVP